MSTFMTMYGLTAILMAGAVNPPLPQTLDLTAIRAVPLQHDGRWPPLDTVARDLVDSVTGDEFFQGNDPVLVLLAWTFDSSTWRDVPVIAIRNAELRRELHLSPTQNVYSFSELARHQHFRELADGLSRIPKGRKLDPLESKVSKIQGKLETLYDVFSGRILHPIPHPTDPLGTWTVVPGTAQGEADSNTVSQAWAELRTTFLADDAPAFSAAATAFASALDGLPAGMRPDTSLIATELTYNRVAPYRTAWQLMLAGALLSAVAIWIKRRWFDALALVGLLGGFGVLTYGLALRWQIAGRIPASNMFESLLFLSWGTGAFAIVSLLVIRHRFVPLTASFMGAVSLMLADCLPMNHFIRPIAPVLLDTVWMSIHVPIIMVSYSVLALGVLIAHVQLVTMTAFPRRRDWIGAIDSLHYWYIHVGSILLLIGIVTGSMWAASSWGRYWGWDPKEVWSLAALLGYLTILHVRINRESIPKWAYVLFAMLAVGVMLVIIPKLGQQSAGKALALFGTGVGMVVFVVTTGPFATAFKSVLAFWLIIMTYVGVNYVLGTGLHSYGFGTGGVARSMFQIGGVDLALIGLCSVIYLFRSKSIARAVPNPV